MISLNYWCRDAMRTYDELTAALENIVLNKDMPATVL